MALTEEERILAFVQRGSSGATNPVANLVADDGAEHHRQENPSQRDDAGGGKDAGRNEQGIAGEKKTNKEAGFDKNNQADEQGSAGSDYSFDIVDGMKQVANRFEQTRSSLRDTCMAAGPTWDRPKKGSENARSQKRSIQYGNRKRADSLHIPATRLPC